METKKLFNRVQVEKVIGVLPEEITSVETDSRKVTKGGLYVAIKGYTVDGHSFIDDVVKKGVKVLVVENLPNKEYEDVAIVKVRDTQRTISYLANAYYDYPSKKMNLVGITGTNGKTSVANMVNDILRMDEKKTGVTGTVGVDIDGELFESKNTTADVLTVQRTLKKMVDAGVTDATMEVSSHGLVLGRLWGVEFNQAVFTNLTQDHLDFHETMEEYGRAKGLLFSQLGQDLEQGKTVILNADDDMSGYYESITSANILTYGMEKEAAFFATNINYHDKGTTFELVTSEGKYQVESPFVGKFNVSNVLAAITTLYAQGMKLEKIIEYLKSVKPVTGRMEKIEAKDGRSVFIDYAHTPDGIEQVLSSVREFAKGKVFFVIGTGGNRDKTKRPIMANKASEGADFVVFTTDNPRFERPEDILEDMEKGMKHKNYIKIPDREEAIFYAIKESEENDVVIIAGKGHEQYQIIGDKTILFNDKSVALRAIEEYPIKK